MRIEILKQSNEIELSDSENKIRIKIEHQLMQILVLLIESEGELVDKKILIDKIWDGNNFTGEGALTKNIYKLRELLKSNNIDKIICIETIPKKGYRLSMNQYPLEIKKETISKEVMLTAAVSIVVVFLLFFIYRSNSHTSDPSPLITINGKDSIFQIMEKNTQVINVDTTTDKVIKLEKIKK